MTDILIIANGSTPKLHLMNATIFLKKIGVR